MNAVLADARRGHSGLYRFAVAMAGLAVVLTVLALVDQRELMGAVVWVKPLKFAISFVTYSGALAWMLGQLREPTFRRIGWVIVAASAIEMVIITVQAARGVRSHFNDDTVGDGLLFVVMGLTIVVLYLATIAIALRFLREPGRDRAAGTAIRLGLLVGLVGLGVGVIMSVIGSHAVGVPDGGPSWRSSAGAPPAATCASDTSWACTPCRRCRCSPPRWPPPAGSPRGRGPGPSLWRPSATPRWCYW